MFCITYRPMIKKMIRIDVHISEESTPKKRPQSEIMSSLIEETELDRHTDGENLNYRLGVGSDSSLPP